MDIGLSSKDMSGAFGGQLGTAGVESRNHSGDLGSKGLVRRGESE